MHVFGWMVTGELTIVKPVEPVPAFVRVTVNVPAVFPSLHTRNSLATGVEFTTVPATARRGLPTVADAGFGPVAESEHPARNAEAVTAAAVSTAFRVIRILYLTIRV
jgi:hypothetical protein